MRLRRRFLPSACLGLAILALPAPSPAGGNPEEKRDPHREEGRRPGEGSDERLTKGDTGTNRAARIEPARTRLPANHLKFYLQFREPMERGDVFRHLRLVEIDPAGREIAEVPDPFRDVELWDASFTRMTLWLHPGRQKPGVNLNVEIGPILEAGKRYRLELSPRWRAESGRTPGTEASTREFLATPADETQPDPRTWEIRPSADGAVATLLTRDALDPVSTGTALTVERSDGSPVAGLQVRVVEGEGASGETPDEATTVELRYSGAEPWPPGRYHLVVDPALEDLAGNSIARPFNLDRQRRPDFQERTEPFRLPFAIPPR